MDDCLPVSVGRDASCGLLLLFTDFNPRDQSALPLSRTAFEGWSKRFPGRARDPLLEEVCFWLMSEMLRQGQVEAARCAALQYDGYLRPSEALELTEAAVIARRGS
jgi:hypothetical protein